MLSTKHVPADKFKLSKLSTKWTGPLQVLQYNPQDQNVSLTFSDFPELSNISNKFYSSLLKPCTPYDDIHFPERELNRPCLVEEVRCEVQKVLEFGSAPKTGKL